MWPVGWPQPLAPLPSQAGAHQGRGEGRQRGFPPALLLRYTYGYIHVLTPQSYNTGNLRKKQTVPSVLFCCLKGILLMGEVFCVFQITHTFQIHLLSINPWAGVRRCRSWYGWKAHVYCLLIYKWTFSFCKHCIQWDLFHVGEPITSLNMGWASPSLTHWFLRLFMAVLGLPCCAGFSPVVVSRGHSLVVVHGLLIAGLL